MRVCGRTFVTVGPLLGAVSTRCVSAGIRAPFFSAWWAVEFVLRHAFRQSASAVAAPSLRLAPVEYLVVYLTRTHVVALARGVFLGARVVGKGHHNLLKEGASLRRPVFKDAAPPGEGPQRRPQKVIRRYEARPVAPHVRTLGLGELVRGHRSSPSPAHTDAPPIAYRAHRPPVLLRAALAASVRGSCLLVMAVPPHLLYLPHESPVAPAAEAVQADVLPLPVSCEF